MEGKDKSHSTLVSIIIPTYNQEEHFLKECIESAINQTHLNIEIIISDNHSTNGASEIIAAYAKKDSRIRIVKPGQFLSLAENFIFAYSNIHGEYVCPLSSDDILYPKIIEEHLKPFKTYPDLSFSYSNPLYFTTETKDAKWKPGKQGTGFYSTQKIFPIYIKRRCCTWGAILFKTRDFRKIGGFSKELSIGLDTDAIVKLMLLGEGVYCINKPLSALRIFEKEERTVRIPLMLKDMAITFDNIERKIAENSLRLSGNIAKRAKKKYFAREVYPIAYFIQFKKRDANILKETVTIINETYPKGFFNFVLRNRENILGLFFSIGFLSLNKIKQVFKKS